MAIRRGGELIGIHTASLRRSEASFSATQRRIANGIAQTASLALANARLFEELEKANRVKSDFVATMSHELRTPLNQIIGYTDLLREESFGELNSEQLDVLGRVSRSSLDLLGMIQATLDLSRLEARGVELQIAPVDPHDLLRELATETRHLQAKPSLAFRWQVESDAPCLHTDPLKLKMVLRNLVSNAVKFTDQGTVVVTAQRRNGGVEFSVRDTGHGIAPEDQISIFEPFRQLNDAHSAGRGGVGLGLYIVRRLVEVLGASLALESEVGRGSTFRIHLAASPVAEPVAERFAV
jgi:signal transduction histidine kinase